MDAGLGGTVLDWQPVQPALARTTRTCSYDRGGKGWSDPGRQPRTSREMATELGRALRAAHLQGPYVLVGHSLGGTNLQVFASEHGNETAGMVLVDSALEEERALPLTKNLQPPPFALKALSVFGVTRLPYMLGGDAPFTQPPRS